jgi:hypothetical protein
MFFFILLLILTAVVLYIAKQNAWDWKATGAAILAGIMTVWEGIMQFFGSMPAP